MNWFRRMFNKPSYEIIKNDVPLTTVMRWYIYDTGLGNENEVASLLGLNPVSEEGDKKERQDSNMRLEAMEPMLPFIDFLATVAGDAIANFQSQEMQKAGMIIDEKELASDMETMRSVYRALAISSLVGGFSIANYLGIVSINAESSDIIPTEGDYYD